MRKTTHLFPILLLVVLAERRAFAYVDPGSGSLIWQMVMAGFVGVSYFIHRVIGWLKRRVKRDDAE